MAKCLFGIMLGGEYAGKGLDKGTKDGNSVAFQTIKLH